MTTTRWFVNLISMLRDYVVSIIRLSSNLNAFNVFVADRKGKPRKRFFGRVLTFDQIMNKEGYGLYLEDTFSDYLDCKKTMSFIEWQHTPKNDMGKAKLLLLHTKLTGLYGCLVWMLLPILTLVAVALWPTLYKHEKHGKREIVTNRITMERYVKIGKASALKPDNDEHNKTKTLRELYKSELDRLEGNCSVDNSGYFSGVLYNGNDFTVESVEVVVVAKNRYRELLWNRTLMINTRIEPKSSSHVIVLAGYGDAFGESEWGIYKARCAVTE